MSYQILLIDNKNKTREYLSSDVWKPWKASSTLASAMCNAAHITPRSTSGFSACILSWINLSNQAVSIVLSWKLGVSKRVMRYSTVVRKSPRIDNSLRAMTRFSRACSLFSPQEKQWPNWESANSWRPPEAATEKYPHTFFEERKFNSWTVPELGLKPVEWFKIRNNAKNMQIKK